MAATNIQTGKKEVVIRKSGGIPQNRRFLFYDKDDNELSNKSGYSYSRGIVDEFRELRDLANGNRIRLVDDMSYADTATAAAAWVAGDTAADTGVTVVDDNSDNLNGTAAVQMTTGAGFTAAVTVTKTLSNSWSSFPEDRFSQKGGYCNWKPYDYIFIPYHAEQALAAADLTVVLTDCNSVSSTYEIPATDSNHADNWGSLSIAFDDFTDGTGFRWDSIYSIGIKLDGTAMGNSEAVTFAEIYTAKYSNGFTPAVGSIVAMELSEDSISEGMQMKLAGGGMLPRVGKGGSGDEEIVGIACGNGDTGDVIPVQVSGPFVGELGSLSSLEVGDQCAGAGAGGLTWTESAGTGADAIAKYIAPFLDSAAQYTLAWFNLNSGGGVPS